MIAPLIMLPFLRHARECAADPSPLPAALAMALIAALSAGGWCLILWAAARLWEMTR